MNEVAEHQFTPAEELSSAQRIAMMNAYRARVRDPEDDGPDVEELRYAVELMRTERSVSAGRSAEKKAKDKPQPLDLDEI